MKTDPPSGPSQKDRLAQAPVSEGGVRKLLVKTLVVAVILKVPAVELENC
jgi:hypothetical protein